MIDFVRFRNFKALRHVDLTLGRLTVLAGPNSSGKTSVLEGLNHLTQLSSQDPREVFRGPANVGVIASRGAVGSLELALIGSFRAKRGTLSITFTTIEDYPFSDSYLLEAQWGDRHREIRRELNVTSATTPPPHVELPLGSLLRGAALLAFDPRRLAEASFSELPTPMIGADGAGLSAILADMSASRPDNHKRLIQGLRKVFPAIEGVRLVRSKVETREVAAADLGALAGRGVAASRETIDRAAWGHEIVFDLRGAADLPARAVSEGMLLVLGLLSTLIGPQRHRVVLVDHLERALSPMAIPAFVEQLYDLLNYDPSLQIIATSNSPHLLDHVHADDVRIHTVLPDGSASLAPLVWHPDFARLKAKFRPGALWCEVGDAWVPDAAKAAKRSVVPHLLVE